VIENLPGYKTLCISKDLKNIKNEWVGKLYTSSKTFGHKG